MFAMGCGLFIEVVSTFLTVSLFRQQTVLEYYAAFRPHVKEQVNDAKIGQEACALTEHLIVRLWYKVRVGSLRRFGRYDVAHIGHALCGFNIAVGGVNVLVKR